MDDIDTNSIAVAGIDIQNVAPLEHPKRLTTFINHFLSTTVFTLNQFTTKCIEKLDEMDRQLECVETQLQILEHNLLGAQQPNNASTNANTPAATPKDDPGSSSLSSNSGQSSTAPMVIGAAETSTP